MGVPVLAEAV